MMRPVIEYVIIFSIVFLMAIDTPDLMAGTQDNPSGKPMIGKHMGPLIVHPLNTRYFSDGNGNIVYLTGSHTWNNFQDIDNQYCPPFSYTKYLDMLNKYHHNFFRLWIWEHSQWLPTARGRITFDPLAYKRTGPGRTLDGGLKYNLNSFNDVFFERLRSRIIEARTRGFYVSVMLFQGFSIQKKETEPRHRFLENLKRLVQKVGLENIFMLDDNPWRAHPFNVQNNINAIDGDPRRMGDGRDIHTLRIPQVTRQQEKYVRKVIDTLGDLDNVLWEISNESHGDSIAWQYHMINYIHDYEKMKGRRHPVLMTSIWPGGENSTLFNSPAQAISPNDQNGYKDNPPMAEGRKVVISDTDHLWGIGGDHTWVWKSFLRGLNPVFMDPYGMQGSENMITNAEIELIRKNMGYCRSFSERINLVKMVPRTDVTSSGYCLADEGEEYLVYNPQDGRVTVDLNHISGRFNVEWFNPSSGAFHQGRVIMGGSQQAFSAPFRGDAILHLYKNH